MATFPAAQGFDIGSIIQAAQLGRSLNPEVMQQQALGNQLAQQLQLLQIAKAQQDITDFNNPGAANTRKLLATLTGQTADPLSGTRALSPEEQVAIREQGNFPSPGAITQTQQAALLNQAPVIDEMGFPSLQQPVIPRAAMGTPVTEILGPGGVPTGFSEDFNSIIARNEALTRAKGTSSLDRLMLSNAEREADRLSREEIARQGNLTKKDIAATKGTTGGGRALTLNQQTNLRLRGGRSLVDINQFTDPETGTIDWNAYASKVGEAEGNTLNANNLIKSARAAKAGAKTTLDEKNFQLYGNRMTQANKALQDLENKGFDATSLGAEGLLGGWSPNLLKTDQRQQFEQAERNFINAVLRRESGAVITDDEFANARAQYLPQPGDGAAVLAQKLANRKLVVDEFARLGGQETTEEATPSNAPSSGRKPTKIESIELEQ